MSATPRKPSRYRLAVQCSVSTILQTASMLLATGAAAQPNACDQLKSVLAARIPPAVRGYSMETVPADAPVPPGAKAIGTCGASKILYRRWGGAQPSSRGAGAAEPASAPNAAPLPVLRSMAAASAVPAPAVEPEQALARSASDVVAARPTEALVAEPAQAQRDETRAGKPPLTQQISEFIAEHWRWGWQWVWALVLLPLAACSWAWLAHRRAYDETGLPRGPKL